MNSYKASHWRALSSLAFPTGPVTINYSYDKLNRLTETNYSDGRFYHYSYDQVGNRLTASDQYSTTTYVYDAANRLASVNGQPYTYDNNGNLLFNGVTTYAYDSANRLISASNGLGTTTYAYNGLGDRLQETTNGQTTTFTVDLAAGLTQTLDDGTNAYLYGYGRIAQVNASDAQYFLGDALGSVRQLTDASGAVTMAKVYDPYGVVSATSGTGETSYGYANEYQNSYSELLYLRARQYSPGLGRFLTRDTWGGDVNSPSSLNRWVYTTNNPINSSDPSGMCENCQSGDVVRFDARPSGSVGIRNEPDSIEIIGHIPDNANVQVYNKYGSGKNAYRKVVYMDSESGKIITGWVKNIRLLDNCSGGIFGCLPVPDGVWTQSYGFGQNSFAEQTCAHGRSQCQYTKLRGLHNGLDFSVRATTPLIWAGSEEATYVNLAGDADPNIGFMYLGYTVVYGHSLANYLNDQAQGTYKVRPGQTIGESGALSNPSHLHLGVRRKSTRLFINPLIFFSPSLRNEIASHNMGSYPSGYTPFSMYAFDASTGGWFWDFCDLSGITWNYEVGG